MFKKGIAITAIFIISNFIQLVSQIVVTRLFGAKLDLDIFLAAVALPTIIVTVIYGTLNDAFLPLYGEQKAKNVDKADAYFVSHLFVLTVIGFLAAFILGFFARPISGFLYAGRGGDFINAVSFQMTYMFYSIPVSVIATICGAYYYLHKQFSRFPFAQAIGSVTNLLLIILLVPILGIFALVFAFIINIIFQIFFVIPPLKMFKSFKVLTFKRLNFSNFLNFFNLIACWVPLIIGSLALRSDTLIIRSFGADLPTGYLVYLNLISKIFILATGMMTIGIQILQLPHLVEYFSGKRYMQAITVVNKSKMTAVALSVAVTVAAYLLAPFFINLLFVGGKFTRHDANITNSLIPIFLLPALGWGVNSVFLQPLIALKKQLAVGTLNVVALILAWTGATVIKAYYGPLAAIPVGLIILLFTGIIGSEILWQKEKSRLLSAR